MDEPGSRTSSLQRKKPPWLKLDIPTIQLTPDDTPALTQPVKRLRSVSMPGENPQTCIAALETSNNYLRPPLERLPSFTQSVKRGTADWFGVSKDSDSTQRWRRKSLQHCSHLYGGLKAQVIREMELHSQDNLSLASTETPPPLYLPPHHPSHHHYGMQRVGWRPGHIRGVEEDLRQSFTSSSITFALLLSLFCIRFPALASPSASSSCLGFN